MAKLGNLAGKGDGAMIVGGLEQARNGPVSLLGNGSSAFTLATPAASKVKPGGNAHREAGDIGGRGSRNSLVIRFGRTRRER
jgi:hypothetical protein